jgi:thioredoxin reductase (NADPH)
MLDYDAVVVGGGPAGLTAGAHLARAGRRVLLLERELYGGGLQHVDQLEDGTGGAELASRLAEEAAAAGVVLREAEVTGIEVFSSTRWVTCEDGSGSSASVVIVAAGSRFRKLGIPGEEALVGRGVIHCVPCDGGLFIGRPVAVCGSDDHALADARYLARLGARVTLVPGEAVAGSPGIETRPPASLEAILGTERVEGIVITEAGTGRRQTLEVAGVVIRAGSEPNTAFLEDVVDLDPAGRVIADDALQTSAPHVLAAGDARAGSRPLVVAAIEDGIAAARRAEELLTLST